jgi:CHASE3 domain sensor protein
MLLGVLLIVAFGTSFFTMHYVFAQTDQTASKLQAANNAVEQAFNAVLDAEKAGANVTALLSRLNLATGLLSQAEMAYRNGNLTAAASYADSVVPIASEVQTDAVNAKKEASNAYQNALWLTIGLSVIGAVIFILALFMIWKRLKRGYLKSLYSAKPEVTIR